MKSSLLALDVFDFWDTKLQLKVHFSILGTALSCSRCGYDQLPKFREDFDTQSLRRNDAFRNGFSLQHCQNFAGTVPVVRSKTV